MNLLEKSDKELLAIAQPMWDNLIHCSNKQDYFGFTQNFSARMLFGANEISSSIGLLSSLGDLFLSSVIFLWLIIFFHTKVHFNLKDITSIKARLRFYICLLYTSPSPRD